MSSEGSIPTAEEKQMRRAFLLAREAMEGDIPAHRQALEQAITQLRVHLDPLGIPRPLGLPETAPTQGPSVRRVNTLLAALNIPTGPQIPYPDPDEDSGAETNRNPRICLDDHPASCTRHEWRSWVSMVWGEYSSLKAIEKILKQTLRMTIVTYTDLEAKHVLNDAHTHKPWCQAEQKNP
ncbi:hypothetical protein BGX38DRAFT_1145721 [Terfezia claveryi]|nr:hypothetical protein BGX38DRAFT_1145721 [Terfezia claveryi]